MRYAVGSRQKTVARRKTNWELTDANSNAGVPNCQFPIAFFLANGPATCYLSSNIDRVAVQFPALNL